MYPDRCFVVGRMLFYTSSAVHQISLIPIPREIQNEKDEFVLKDKMTIGVAEQTTITRRQLLGRPFCLVLAYQDQAVSVVYRTGSLAFV